MDSYKLLTKAELSRIADFHEMRAQAARSANCDARQEADILGAAQRRALKQAGESESEKESRRLRLRARALGRERRKMLREAARYWEAEKNARGETYMAQGEKDLRESWEEDRRCIRRRAMERKAKEQGRQ